MAKKPQGGLTKWFKEKWVDISRPKKGGGFEPCGRKKASSKAYPKCRPAAEAARMTKKERDSAIRRKRRAGNPGGKPKMVATYTKKGKTSLKRKARSQRRGKK